MSELTERNFLRQGFEIVNARHSFSKSESDLVYTLLTTIKKEDEDFKDYTFTKAELEAKLGLKLDTDQLRATARSLMSKVLEISKEKKGKWTLLSWFSYFDYDNGIITCRFDKAMKPHYLNLQQFVSADVRQMMQMKGLYSRRMYMLIKERAKFGERKFVVEDLMDILQVPKSYKIYNRFKTKVLNQAVEDINKFTDIEIKNIGTAKAPIYFEERKIITKVTEVTFRFKKNMIDINAFIDYIRDIHTNEALYTSKDGRILKCSEKGLLYYSDNIMEWVDAKDALVIWQWLHEHRDKLYINQPSLIPEDIFA
jgi:plasmid replication initiation protein